VSLTDEGRHFHAQVAPLLASLEDATAQAAGAAHAVQGRFRVNVDPWIAHLLLAPRLSAFLTSHPLLSLELLVRDSLGDLVSEGVDEAPATRRLVSRAQIQTSCARHGPSSPKESASSRSPSKWASVSAPWSNSRMR
jgi:DNA-binding transcriptional LysR family regulator